MTVNILLITHEKIGSALLSAVTTTLGELTLPTTVVTVDYETDPISLIPQLKRLIDNINYDSGLLILTDLYGSTPCNIAAKLQDQQNIKIVAGLNLPMLIRVMNYAHLDLSELALKAYSGGKDGVVNCNKVTDDSKED